MRAVLISAGRALAATAAVFAVASPGAAQAVVSGLRVEAGDRSLAAASFVNGTARIKTDDRAGCGGSGDTATLRGATALGLVSYAAHARGGLRPFRVSDEFSFGLFVCGIGDFAGSDSAFWLYKVDHRAPDVGGDQFALDGGEEVLWYFQDTARNVNTGDELVLEAPARARPGEPFGITVWVYDAQGNRSPAADAQVTGESVQRTDANGRARIVADSPGDLRLRATRGPDIPSAALDVCLADELSDCPARRGERILGTSRGDRIAGTRGADTVLARGGADRVRVLGGGRDVVRCGRGRDRVTADRHDSVARDCERVRRR
jgi:RTX calcium-binding nonapeptide repeat (4 copies)